MLELSSPGDMRVLVLLLVVAAASAQGLEMMWLTAPTNPSYSLEKWMEVLSSQALREEVCVGCKPGTMPQHPSAGVVVAPQAGPGRGTDRIINGNLATAGQFPWQVAITMDNSYLCGGSVISEQWILTAGHCVSGFSSFSIILGDISRLYKSSTTVIANTYKSVLHDGFDLDTITNDIGLLNLLFPVTFNDGIRPVKLPTPADAANTFEGEMATVSGFGKTYDSGSSSSSLRYVEQPIMSNTRCARYFGDLVRDYNICGDGSGEVGACNGDSGGALVVEMTDGKWTQVGIVSYGSDAGCTYSQPTVYTRVTSFLKWIQDKTGLQP